ncbi:MAG TPA: histidine triad nucleotide-binding protein [Dissulfurispiraceae bacterium]|nr:histidine triad nucleotide-binding protein [Dissulfurispiraceae bacterium]
MSDCIFCRIVSRKLPARIIYEDDTVLAFEDIDPKAPVHTLIIPKKHYSTLLDVTEDDNELLGHIINVAQNLARDKGIAERGFRIVTNCNPESGQSVYHIHFHVLGGRQMHWPPG